MLRHSRAALQKAPPPFKYGVAITPHKSPEAKRQKFQGKENRREK